MKTLILFLFLSSSMFAQTTGIAISNIGIVGGIGSYGYWKNGMPIKPIIDNSASYETTLASLNEYHRKYDRYERNRKLFVAGSVITFASGIIITSLQIAKKYKLTERTSLVIEPTALTISF